MNPTVSHPQDTPAYTGKSGQTDTLADLSPSSPQSVLVRATNGASSSWKKRPQGSTTTEEKIKLSTVVAPEELEAFYARYADVCRAGMPALKKRDRSAQKKKAQARKRKVAAEAAKAAAK